MNQNSEIVIDPNIVYDQYQIGVNETINIPSLPGSVAITSLNGLAGPTLNIDGGTTGYTFVPGGTTITMTGSPVGGTAVSLLATVSLNLNTNTKQALYTVPVGKSAIITEITLRGPSVDLSGGALNNLNFGFDAGATDWGIFGTASLTASNMFVVINQFAVGSGGGGPSIIGTAGQIFGAITDAAFGSPATVTVNVIGYEF